MATSMDSMVEAAAQLKSAVRRWNASDCATSYFNEVLTWDGKEEDAPGWPMIEFSVPDRDHRKMVKVVIDLSSLSSEVLRDSLAKAVVSAVADNYDFALEDLWKATDSLVAQRKEVGYPYYEESAED